MRHVVVECYPARRGASFGEFSTAYAACWITERFAADDAAVIACAREKIAAIDWSIAEVFYASAPELKHELLAELHGRKCQVVIDIGDNAMVTCPPFALRDALLVG